MGSEFFAVGGPGHAHDHLDGMLSAPLGVQHGRKHLLPRPGGQRELSGRPAGEGKTGSLCVRALWGGRGCSGAMGICSQQTEPAQGKEQRTWT